MAGCLIVFSGVVLYKVTYHLDKHNVDHEEGDGIVRYQHVNGSKTEIEGDEDSELWIKSVSAEMLNGDSKKAYEMESIGIQMGLPTVQVEETLDEEEEENESDSSIRHRIT